MVLPSIKVVSVNTGKATPISTKSGWSGIDKRPRAGRVAVGRLGVDGDKIVDLENHGGVDQAVYVYCADDYSWWEAELGQSLRPGQFGENLTISGMVCADACIGDRLSVGGLALEVTSPRIPCATFAAHMGDKQFVSRFFRANRTGFYCRVIAEGDVGASDHLEYPHFGGPHVPAADMVEYYGFKALNADQVARFQAVPMHYKAVAELNHLYPRS